MASMHTRLFLLLAAFLIVCSASCLFPQASLAQPVTYTQWDITTGATGSFTYAAGSPPTYTISGAGTGFSLSGDSMSFVSTPASGNIEFEGEVVSQGATGANAQAGLMIRSTVDGHETAYAIAVTPGGGCNFYYHEFSTINGVITGPVITAPVYLRLVRNGSTISGYYSTTGLGNWTLVGSYTVTRALPNLYFVGFLVDSSVSGTLNTSVFKYVTYMSSVPQPSSTLLQWLRADVGVTSTAGKVSAWADQSGNANNATQATGALQPSVVAGAIDSAVMPTVTFNGTSQYMSVASDFANLTSGATVIAVLEPTSATATGTPCAYGNAANSDAIFPQTIGTQAKLNVYNSTTSSSVTTTTNPLSNSSYQILEETFLPGASANTGTGTIYVNGTQQAQSTTMVQTMANITRSSNVLGTGIGLSNYFQGGIAELLVYSAPLTASQRASVEAYIFTKYAVGNEPTLDLPTLSPAAGTFSSASVWLSQDQGAAVFVTGDGTTPTTSTSPFFLAAAIPITQTTTLKTLAVEPGFHNSSVLSSTYQINSSSPLAPAGNGLIMWLRADMGVTTSGSNVTKWSDESGAGNNASQSVTGNQPTLVTNAINGLPAVNFTSSSSQFLQVPPGLADFTSGTSIFAVLSPATFPVGARILDFGNGAASDNLLVEEPSSNAAALYTYNTSSPTSATASNALTANQFQLLEAIDGSATARIFTNSVQQGQSTTMNNLNNISRSKNFIGQASAGGSYFNGKIAELLVYNRAVTPTEQAQIEGYLTNRYLTTSATPQLSIATSSLTAPAQVAIAAPAGTVVHFTTDGTTPTLSSPIYNGPINILYTQTLKAIAVVGGFQSSVASATYTLNANSYPAPSGTDTTTLNINLQLPSVPIPQDSNQH